jgi:hypothetical protein
MYKYHMSVKKKWCMPVIPATWEVEIGRINVHGQLQQKDRETQI